LTAIALSIGWRRPLRPETLEESFAFPRDLLPTALIRSAGRAAFVPA